MRLAATACVTAVFAACLCASAAFAQLPSPPVPRPYLSAETRGQVVDAESGGPLEGAVVVARWEWETWAPPQFHGGGYYTNNGDVVHMGEAASDRDGRFSIADWGPEVRADGRLAADAPRLFFFKAGYEPLQAPLAGLGGGPVRLKKFTGSPQDYAQAIAALQGSREQGVGLAWAHPGANWKAMPRMILAIHREKARLGADGAPIRGANLLFGRAGQGEAIDAGSGQPIASAVVSVMWTLRRLDGAPGTRRVFEQKRIGADSSSGRFYVSPWRLPGPQVAEWEIVPEAQPQVRIYALGYERLPDIPWSEQGAVLRLKKRPATREAVLAQLREWRGDIDRALAAEPQRDVALAGQGMLLWFLADQCRQLTPDVQAGLCFPADSDAMRYAEKVRASPVQMVETFEGPHEMKIVAVGGGQAHAIGAAAPAMPFGYGPREPVRGFSIEPVR